jgi:hypothetical protein
MRALLLLTFAIALVGCDKTKDPIAEPATATFKATLKLTVVHLDFVNGNQTSSPAQNATVRLYETRFDALNEFNEKFNGITNADGLVVFTAIAKPKYYMRISHALHGTKIDSVDTPNNSVTLWEETI